MDSISQHDGRCHQVESASLVKLLPKTAVTDFAQPVKEHCPGRRVACLALVGSSLHTAEQLHASKVSFKSKTKTKS